MVAAVRECWPRGRPKFVPLDDEGDYRAALTEGTEIGKITIDGTDNLYAPTASAIAVDTELSATSENPVQNKVVNAALENKMDTSLETLIKYERGKTGTLTFTTTEELTEVISVYASITLQGFRQQSIGI